MRQSSPTARPASAAETLRKTVRSLMRQAQVHPLLSLVLFTTAAVAILAVGGFFYEPRAFLLLPSYLAGHQRRGRVPPGAMCSTCRVRDGQPDSPEFACGPLKQIELDAKGDIHWELGRKGRDPDETNPPFVNMTEHFPEARLIEAQWETIRCEAQCVMSADDSVPTFDQVQDRSLFIDIRVDYAQKRIAKGDDVPWRTFLLKMYGEWVEDNLALVPETGRILKEAADSRISNALFSILDPGKHIPAHCGPFKTVFRYHLGLVVPQAPEEPIYIINDNLVYKWKEGEGVLFDDTFRHEVFSKSTRKRVVLFMDIHRTDIPASSSFMHHAAEYLIRRSPMQSKAKREGTVKARFDCSHCNPNNKGIPQAKALRK